MDDHRAARPQRNPAKRKTSGNWIKLHRRLIRSEVFGDAHLLQLWIYLLCRANYRSSTFRLQRIEPGQVAFSQRHVCEALAISRGKLQRDLKKLVAMGSITIKASRDFSIVTISNWKTYQRHAKASRATDSATGGATNKTTDGTTNDATDGATNGAIPKNSKKFKEPPPTPPSQGSSARPSWQEVEEELVSLGLNNARDAVIQAKARGLSLCDAGEIIDSFRDGRGAWQQGALYKRFTGEFATWPKVDGDFKRDQSAKSAVTRQESRRTELLNCDRQRQADADRLRALEEQHGAEFDRLGENEKRELFATVYPDDGGAAEYEYRRFERSGQLTTPQRLAVLQAMEAQGIT